MVQLFSSNVIGVSKSKKTVACLLSSSRLMVFKEGMSSPRLWNKLSVPYTTVKAHSAYGSYGTLYVRRIFAAWALFSPTPSLPFVEATRRDSFHFIIISNVNDRTRYADSHNTIHMEGSSSRYVTTLHYKFE